MDQEEKMDALKDFVMKTLSNFKAELGDLRKRVEGLEEHSGVMDSSLADMDHKVENLLQSTSTPKRKQTQIEEDEEEEIEDKAKVPTELIEISNPLRDAVKPFYESVKYMKDKEKVNKLQLAYIHYWISQRCKDEIYRSEFSYRIISDGTKDGIWPPGWQPADIKGNFQGYLHEKLKNIIRKARVQRESESLSLQLEYCSKELNL